MTQGYPGDTTPQEFGRSVDLEQGTEQSCIRGVTLAGHLPVVTTVSMGFTMPEPVPANTHVEVFARVNFGAGQNKSGVFEVDLDEGSQITILASSLDVTILYAEFNASFSAVRGPKITAWAYGGMGTRTAPNRATRSFWFPKQANGVTFSQRIPKFAKNLVVVYENEVAANSPIVTFTSNPSIASVLYTVNAVREFQRDSDALPIVNGSRYVHITNRTGGAPKNFGLVFSLNL